MRTSPASWPNWPRSSRYAVASCGYDRPSCRVRPTRRTSACQRVERTLLAGDGRLADFGEDFVGDVEVGPDVLHVVEVLERFDQAQDLLGGVVVERYLDAGQPGGVGGLQRQAGGLDRSTYRVQVGRFADYLERLAEVVDLLRAGVEHR